MRVQALFFFAVLPFWACTPSSDLSGSYIGSAVCGEEEEEYNIELALNATESSFVYSGGLLFQYTEVLFISGDEVDFTANFLYDISATQPVRNGAQDIYFDVTWEEVGCERDYPEAEDERGIDVCEEEGIDLSILGDTVGSVIWRYDGNKRLSIEDESCQGFVER
ncbi:MAG: hypothetical protein VXZ96_01795 [Myxococcota bacterium]|nr:hypothetical protein [Myxococcota bacterium]